MSGLKGPDGKMIEDLKGIMPRAASHIFSCIDAQSDKRKYLVRCSYIEIYNEDIRDLLGSDSKAKHELKEDPDKGVFVKGLTMQVTKTISDVEKVISMGDKNRTVGQTKMNDKSSRSHSIFTIFIET